jgi:flagella basal body P-ring formation protein FlgA
MPRLFCSAALFYLIMSASHAFADPVTLRPRVEASGVAITLGDVFDGAGEAAGRAIAPAPPPGQVSTLSVPLLSAAASAAGLDWTPPPGLTDVRVVRPGGLRATLPATTGARMASEAAVRRGDTVTLLYQVPGVSLSMRARALEDGAVGQSVRLLNTSSNRTVEGVVTGPGAARVSP